MTIGLDIIPTHVTQNLHEPMLENYNFNQDLCQITENKGFVMMLVCVIFSMIFSSALQSYQ